MYPDNISTLASPSYYLVGKRLCVESEENSSVIEKEFDVKVDTLIVSITEGLSGNLLLNSILNGHPEIADIGYTVWGGDIFVIVEWLWE